MLSLRILLLSYSLFHVIIIMTKAVKAFHYPIGTAGQKWGEKEILEWRETRCKIQRSYEDEVVKKIDDLRQDYIVEEYGTLSHNPKTYRMYCIRSKTMDPAKPNVLITGGVHGYETSGVQGAILFLQTKAKVYEKDFNIIVAPCVSPWGYETIQRWNYNAVDPNRSFNPDGEQVEGRSFNPEAATEESSTLIKYLKEKLGVIDNMLCHVDLHETTDTDATEFRPAKAARDGITDPPKDSIPDGFYLVADETSEDETKEWYTSMINAVKQVTHIAPADEPDGTIIGERVCQDGVIAIPSPKSLGLCAGLSNAPYATTTEVYPDSPNATPDICNAAQVACIQGALDYLIANVSTK